MAKIYDLTLSYRINRRYVNWTFRQFYGKFVVLGKKNIPEKGPVIFAPNHLNALMDALLILKSTPSKLSNVFLARSDIFQNKVAARILRYLKILPAFRMRDGIENLGKNNETFEKAKEVLDEKNALCMMPEGNQGDQRKLRPMVKGIFRIAFSAQESYGNTPGVRIIPVGIDYEDREKFGADVIINYGDPIEVSDYMQQHAENPAVATNELRAYLKGELHKLTLDLATETHYDCFETTVYVANTAVVHQLGLKNNVAERFLARQKAGEFLVEMEKDNPEKVEKLDTVTKEFTTWKNKLNLPVSIFENPGKVFSLILTFLLLLVTSPVFVAGFLLNMFPFLLPGIIRKAMKIKYDGFFSSFDYVLGAIFTFPLFYIIQTVLFGIFSPTPWWVIPIFAVGQFVLGKLSFLWYKKARVFAQKIRYRWLKLIKPDDVQTVQQLRNEIISYVNLK